ncbi:LysR family transcriptional regulator [Roseateles puraquae]|jgi:DNA-binding transcriptional LysR family regulator|uniref:LysR family transcriptional regulator n=1 Tax=Roseateles puraquae TaxID=431059 RepID=A0A254N8T6_9BURK|nr:LysR family transcriptional regulator [Roseateles puraquae]MBL8275532.1 LysR family transcriptional regulator [Roseateles sp.]MDG0854356.1 LysR family transcriptional regulator [Roseateles puraquae]OWR00761.1 LysR family transcriptional regulator [Roseateles puraquae]
MLKNATFRQLAAFHAVARLGSVSRAAGELHLTQPAVSIQLKLLEESAGAPLLERQGRGIRLSAAGEVMADYAARILDLWREAGDEMAAQRGQFSGTLRVGAVTTAEYLLPPLLVAFAAEHPDVKVKLRVGNRDEIVAMLGGQEVDIAIMGRPPGELKTTSAAFAKHPMAFLASPKHPLMAQRDLTLADLHSANLLVRERGSGTRTTLERLYKDAGLPLRIGSEMSSNEAIKQMCAAGFGAAFLSLHTCGLELQAGLLALLPMAGNPLDREWHVMHLATRRLPQVASAFKQFLADDGQRLILEQLRTGAATPGVTSRAPRSRTAQARNVRQKGA